MQQIVFKLTGTSPLIMHNGRLADPFDEFAAAMKEITSKKNKTKDDFYQLARLEWEGGLYYDAELGPYIPGVNIEACIRDGARTFKKGKDIECGLIAGNTKNAIETKWPLKKSLDSIFKEGKFVFQCMAKPPGQTSRIKRTRPIFDPWSALVPVIIDERILDAANIKQFFETAGIYKGICDGKPKYGRFDIEVIE